MNVLYDYSIFQLQRYGGISRYFYEMISCLSMKNEINVNLFEGFHINEYEFQKNKENFGWYCGYKTFPFPGSGYLFDTLNRIWFNHVYDDFSNLNIFHSTYYRGDLSRFKKSPVVLTVHDMIHELYSDQYSKSDPETKYKRLSINSADAIICVSMNTKEDLLKFYDFPEENIWVVYHGSSLNRSMLLDPGKIVNEDFMKKPYFLYVGKRDGYKNFLMLLDVYATRFADDFHLVCFGGGKFNETELGILNKLKLSSKVIQVDGSDEFLASLYKYAFCLIYPSLYEGFGIPPLEAMSLGCPVIASNTSSIPEVVSGGGILFDPFSKDDLIRSIDSLMNPNIRSHWISKGFEQEKKFSWDRTTNETLNVYESIIS